MGVPGEAAREWRRLHNEEFYDLYPSPDIIRLNKLKIRWEGHVARMRDRTGHTGF
jgi:hypothetical protein